MSKILQIIQAPKGLDAAYLFKPDRDIFTPTEEPDRHELRPVVCMALVEQNDGNKDVVPMVVEDDAYGKIGCGFMRTNNIVLAEEYDDRSGFGYYEFEGTVDNRNWENYRVRITGQDEFTIILLNPMNAVIPITCDYTGDGTKTCGVFVAVNGDQVCLGVYEDSMTARLVAKTLAEEIERKHDYCMPNDSDGHAMKRNYLREQATWSGSEMCKAFGSPTSRLFQDLFNAGCYTLDDVKKLTKEQLMNTKGIKEKRCKQIVEELNKRGYFPK